MAPKRAEAAPPHFFKVILPATLQDMKLMIPPMFVKKFGDKLSDVATLTLPNGRVWELGLEKTRGMIWFNIGWNEFVEYHSIYAGCVLIFKYQENSNFHVRICDKTACEIEYPNNDDEREQNVQQVTDDVNASNCKNGVSVHRKKKLDKNDVNVNASSSFAHELASKRTKYDEHELLGLLEAMGIYITTQCNNFSAKDKERVINAARSVRPKNQAFIVLLRPDNVFRSRLYVPMKFAEKYLSTNVVIRLTDSSGKQYTVEVNWTSGAGCNLADGWSQFSKDNNLKKGDICIFELMSTEDILLKVSVFQAVDSDGTAREIQYRNNNDEREQNVQKVTDDVNAPNCKNAGSVHLKKKLNKNDLNENAPSSSASKRTISDEHELLALLEAMGMYITVKCNHLSAKDKERVITAARSVKPKNHAFIVILRPDNLVRRRLYVPMKFAKKYFSTNVRIRLTDSCGKEYTAKAIWDSNVGCKGGCKLADGWSQFSKDNNLKKGDICIFELMSIKDCLLKVSVIHANDPEIHNIQRVRDDGNASNHKNAGSVHREKKVNRDDLIVNAWSSIAQEPANEHGLLALLEAMGIYIATQCNNLSAKDKERVISAARLVKPKNPAFMVIIVYPDKIQSRLYVPMKFAKKYFSTNVIIRLTDSCGKQYTVEVNWSGAAGCNLAQGWSQFSKDNNLKKGDICIFELMSTEDNLLKVSVFQATDPEIHNIDNDEEQENVKIEIKEEMEDDDSVVMTGFENSKTKSFGACSTEEKSGLKIEVN